MIDHIGIPVSDHACSDTFYEQPDTFITDPDGHIVEVACHLTEA